MITSKMRGARRKRGIKIRSQAYPPNYPGGDNDDVADDDDGDDNDDDDDGNGIRVDVG